MIVIHLFPKLPVDKLVYPSDVSLPYNTWQMVFI